MVSMTKLGIGATRPGSIVMTGIGHAGTSRLGWTRRTGTVEYHVRERPFADAADGAVADRSCDDAW